MGQLIDGIWQDVWYDTSKTGGAFERTTTSFRNWITPDGRPGPTGEGDFRAESGRYHLYVSHACPWAHRTLILRALKGLAPLISLSVVHPDMASDGWTFAQDFPGTTGDTLYGLPFLRDLYTKADPHLSGRVTVPVLWDKQRQTIVSNESAEIIQMFNSAFNALTGNDADFDPAELRDARVSVDARIYDTINNGVYKSGFATTQAAYDAAVTPLFDSLDWLEARLTDQRFLMGSAPTLSDWRLFTTLVRFDAVYHGHFKCNRARLLDFPALWAYTRDLYQWPGVGETVHLDHIIRHYHWSHTTISPNRIIPIGPRLDFHAAHGRESLSKAQAR